MITRKRRWLLTNPEGGGGVDTFNKPAKWAVTSGGVGASFQPLWTGLDMCFPIWDGAGDPIDVAPGAAGRTLGLNTNPYGSAPDGDVIDITGVLQMVTSTTSNVATPVNRSVMAVFTPITFPAGDLFRHIWGLGGGGAWLCDLGFDDRGYVLYYEVTSGAVNLFSPIGTIALNNRYCLVGVSDNTAGMRIHINGAQVANNADTGFLAVGALTGAANLSSSPFVAGACHWLLHMSTYWTRAISVAEANLISNDPYGLVRAA